MVITGITFTIRNNEKSFYTNDLNRISLKVAEVSARHSRTIFSTDAGRKRLSMTGTQINWSLVHISLKDNLDSS